MKKHYASICFLILFIAICIPGTKDTAPPFVFLGVVFLIEGIFLFTLWKKSSTATSDITIIIFSLLLIWEVLTKHLDITNPVLIPPPEHIFYVFVTHGDQMIVGVFSSLELLVIGFAVSLAAGVGLGLFIGWIPRLSNMMYPIIKVLAPIPSVIYTPYIIAVMPTFRSASAMVIILGLFFPTLMQMIGRVHSIDRRIVDSARAMNLGTKDMIFKVFLPYLTPGVIGGLRISLSTSFMILVLAEMMGATSGLGYFIKNYADFANYANVIAGIILVGIVITLLNGLITLIQKRFIKWKMI